MYHFLYYYCKGRRFYFLFAYTLNSRHAVLTMTHSGDLIKAHLPFDHVNPFLWAATLNTKKPPTFKSFIYLYRKRHPPGFFSLKKKDLIDLTCIYILLRQNKGTHCAVHVNITAQTRCESVENSLFNNMADKQRTVVVGMDGSKQAIEAFKCKSPYSRIIIAVWSLQRSQAVILAI